MMDEAVIQIKNITKVFQLFDKKGNDNENKRIHALNDISFDVKKGEIVALVGSNGSGKSTLLNILSGIVKPSSGKIIIRGEVASILDLGSNFHPDLTGYENAKMYISNYKKNGLAEFINQVREFSGLKEYFDQPIKSYSKGMFLRLAFSTVFMQDADIYLLDEVLNVGDESFRMKINVVYKELLQKQKTILLATHDKQETMAMSTRCVWIEKGVLIRDDKPQNVILEYSKSQRLKFEAELFNMGKKDANPILHPKPNEDIFHLKNDTEDFANENLRVNEISISGKSAPLIFREEEIKIVIKIFKKIENASLSLQIKIRDEFNQPVLFTVSLYNSAQKNFDEQFKSYTGLMEYVCIIPAYFLASGKYFLSFWVGKNSDPEQPLYNERAYHFSKEISFNVRNKIFEFISDPVHYSVHPALQWEVKNI